MFLVIEGPNGVGKTTVTAGLAERLADRHAMASHLTTEPTDTALGRLLRFAGEEVTGTALALGIAADRMLHVQREIVPAIAAGSLVISDRYVPSSLVLQRLDGLDLEWIWSLNQFALAPDLVVYLRASAEVLAARLSEREARSRMEVIGTPERELALYEEAFEFLDQRGWNQTVIECDELNAREVADLVFDSIDPQLLSAYK